jgi:hypothetical protein
MPTYKNKKDGAIRVFSRTRTYINSDGTKREVDAVTGEDITADWELVVEKSDYKSITAKKNPNDGYGTR